MPEPVKVFMEMLDWRRRDGDRAFKARDAISRKNRKAIKEMFPSARADDIKVIVSAVERIGGTRLAREVQALLERRVPAIPNDLRDIMLGPARSARGKRVLQRAQVVSEEAPKDGKPRPDSAWL